MFALIITVAWPWMFLCAAPLACDCSRDGPIFKEAFFMANEKEAPAIPERATAATTQSATVPLNEFVLQRERFSHRKAVELTDRGKLLSMMNSLIVDGQLTPVEFYTGPGGEKIVIRGHRRISAMRQLAKENVPNFSLTMPVKAEEVLNANPADLVVRSIADNMMRRDLSPIEQIRAAKTLHDGGVETNRAAYALGYSPKHYLRFLPLAEQDWLLDHIERDEVGQTDASELLAAAAEAKRIPDLKKHLAFSIEETKKRIRQRLSREKKGGPFTEVKVKKELSKELIAQWIEQLAAGSPLDDQLVAPEPVVEPDVAIANIDATANKVTFSQSEIDLFKMPIPELAKAVATVAGAQMVMVEYLKKRHALEAPEGPQAFAMQESGHFDVSVLRSLGLGDLADELAQSEEPAGEPGPVGASPTDAKDGKS